MRQHFTDDAGADTLPAQMLISVFIVYILSWSYPAAYALCSEEKLSANC